MRKTTFIAFIKQSAIIYSYESRIGALADLELALRIKASGPNLENEDFVVVAGDMLFQVQTYC